MRANVWIHKDNETKWEEIPNKSAWLNTILSNADDTSKWGETRDSPVGPLTTVLTETIKPIKSKQDAEKAVQSLSRSQECKAGHIADEHGKCMQKGCKYSRFARK